MYEIKKYNEDLDLTFFYKKCAEKGFTNNSSKEKLIDSFKNDKEYQLWILYYNNKPVGSTAIHSFDDIMGKNSYRICVRTCILTDELNILNVRSVKTGINKHQNISSQIYIPLCIKYTPTNSKLYITSSNKEKASMKLVHKIFLPELSKMSIVKKIKNIIYKGTEQTVWQLFPDLYLKSLEKYPKWSYKII
jgi:hypothetical protein